MKARLIAVGLATLQLCGCAGQAGPSTARIGSPTADIDTSVLKPALPLRPAPAALPDRIALPASYRLVLLDGHMTLVRETDEQTLEPAPTSLRVVAGEISRGELAYQPALLPQELAAEVAASRESAARMDDALESVMSRSRELAEQAKAAQAQSEKLATLLAAAEARLREKAPAPAPKPAAITADPDEVRP